MGDITRHVKNLPLKILLKILLLRYISLGVYEFVSNFLSFKLHFNKIFSKNNVIKYYNHDVKKSLKYIRQNRQQV